MSHFGAPNFGKKKIEFWRKISNFIKKSKFDYKSEFWIKIEHWPKNRILAIKTNFWIKNRFKKAKIRQVIKFRPRYDEIGGSPPLCTYDLIV